MGNSKGPGKPTRRRPSDPNKASVLSDTAQELKERTKKKEWSRTQKQLENNVTGIATAAEIEAALRGDSPEDNDQTLTTSAAELAEFIDARQNTPHHEPPQGPKPTAPTAINLPIPPPPSGPAIPEGPSTAKQLLLETYELRATRGEKFANQRLSQKAQGVLFPIFDKENKRLPLEQSFILEQAGFAVVGAAIDSRYPDEVIDEIQAIYPEAIRLPLTPSISNSSNDSIVLFLCDKESSQAFEQAMRKVTKVTKTAHDGSNSELAYTPAGVSIVGGGINYIKKVLTTKAEDHLDPTTTTQNSTATRANDTLTDFKIENLRFRSSPVINNLAKTPLGNKFVAHIRLEKDTGPHLKTTLFQIADIAIRKHGCKALIEGSEVLILGIHERPDSSIAALRDDIMGYLDDNYGSEWSAKYIHAPLAIDLDDARMTTKKLLTDLKQALLDEIASNFKKDPEQASKKGLVQMFLAQLQFAAQDAARRDMLKKGKITADDLPKIIKDIKESSVNTLLATFIEGLDTETAVSIINQFTNSEEKPSIINIIRESLATQDDQSLIQSLIENSAEAVIQRYKTESNMNYALSIDYNQLLPTETLRQRLQLFLANTYPDQASAIMVHYLQQQGTTNAIVHGEFIDRLKALPFVQQEIVTDQSLAPFTNSSRYFKAGIQLETIKVDGKEITVVSPEKAELELDTHGFVGRDKEVAEIEKIIEESKQSGRILEVKGAAGAGKTELLLQTLPKGSLILRPSKGKGKTEVLDIAQQLIDYIDDNAKNFEGQDWIFMLQEKLDEIVESDGEEGLEMFPDLILSLLEQLAQFSDEPIGFLVDDFDDMSHQGSNIIIQVLGSIKRDPKKYKNIFCTLSRRSDVGYAEGHLNDKTKTDSEAGQASAINFVTQRIVTDHIYVEPLTLSEKKENLIVFSPWLENFIVGKALSKIENGKHKDRVSQARVRKITDIGSLLIREQAGARIQPDGSVQALPLYSVLTINELCAQGLLQFNPQTNELYLTDPEKAKSVLPQEREGLHAMEFSRISTLSEKYVALACTYLEGLSIELAKKLAPMLPSSFSFFGMIEELQNTREMLGGGDKIKVDPNWKKFFKSHLEQNPDLAAEIQITLAPVILELAKDPKYADMVPAILVHRLHQNILVKAPELNQYALEAAQDAIAIGDYNEAIQLAETFLAKGVRESLNDQFKAHLIILRAAAQIGDFEKSKKHYDTMIEANLSEQQQLKLLETQLETDYLYFKHCETSAGADETQEAFSQYDQTLQDAQEKLGDSPYVQALIAYHKARNLKEKTGNDRKLNSDQKYQQYLQAEQLATEAATKTQRALEKDQRNPNAQKLDVIMSTLLAGINIELARQRNKGDFNQVYQVAESGEDTKTTAYLTNVEKYSQQALTKLREYKINDAKIRVEAAAFNALGMIYHRTAPTTQIIQAIESFLTYCNFAPATTAKGRILNYYETAHYLTENPGQTDPALIEYIKKLQPEILATNYQTDPDIFTTFNYIYYFVHSSIEESDLEKVKAHLDTTLQIFQETEHDFTQLGAHYVMLVAEHALITLARLGEDALKRAIVQYRKLENLTPEIIDQLAPKKPTEKSSQAEKDAYYGKASFSIKEMKDRKQLQAIGQQKKIKFLKALLASS